MTRPAKTVRKRTSAPILFGSLTLLAGCSNQPPDAVTGPIEPQVTVLEDISTVPLPTPASDGYCQAAQQILASTTLTGSNTVFTDMPSYRHSKSAANPHRIYQVVTYAGTRPIAVSCKVKTAAHLRAVYGPRAAGTQHGCVALTRRARDTAVAALATVGQAEAAARAAAFVLDDNAPYLTGWSYLGEFDLSYTAADGTLHLRSPGLFQNYDSWITRWLPWQVQGQHYCHTATADYIAALATGAMPPGTVITSVDDAPVTPQ